MSDLRELVLAEIDRQLGFHAALPQRFQGYWYTANLAVVVNQIRVVSQTVPEVLDFIAVSHKGWPAALRALRREVGRHHAPTYDTPPSVCEFCLDDWPCKSITDTAADLGLSNSAF